MGVRSKRAAARSGQMECPICIQKRRLVEHHIHGRAIMGKNRMWNRVYICPSCHDAVHSGDIIVEGFCMTTEGKKFIWRDKKDAQIAKSGAEPHIY